MKHMFKLVAGICAPLLLSGCLLIPGKFDSKLTLKNDGAYTFVYNGQMQLMADDGPMGGGSQPFDPDSMQCMNEINDQTGEVRALPEGEFGEVARFGTETDQAAEDAAEVAEDAVEALENAADAAIDDGDGAISFSVEERDCTEEEIAAGRKEHDDRQANRKKQNDEQAATMGMMTGGAIPGDDKSLKKFAAQLAKYDGWNKVEYVGKNVFEVEYAISGRFDQNFAFPTIPSATMQFPFVQIIRRNGGELEVLTPAMAGPGGLMGAAATSGLGGDKAPDMEPIDGNFVIETEGEILSNNSADGYVSKGSMKTIRWKVGKGGALGESPRAIVKLAR